MLIAGAGSIQLQQSLKMKSMWKSNDGNQMMEFLKPYLDQMVHELREIKMMCQQMKGEMDALKASVISVEDTVTCIKEASIQNPDADGRYQSQNTVITVGTENNSFGNDYIPFGCAKPKANGDDIILKVVSEQDEQYAVFYIRKGERESEVDFNPKSTNYAIMYAEAQLFPYFEVEYGKGVPSGVDTLEKGKALWEDGKWVLKKKPKIRIV